MGLGRIVELVPRGLRASSSFRGMGEPIYRAYARTIIFFPGPPILVNSLPKAGTHLLTSLLDRFPKVIYSGEHRTLNQFDSSGDVGGSDPNWTRVSQWLQSRRCGQYSTAHFPAEARLFGMLDQAQLATLFVIRDPRDIVVSTTQYILSLRRNYMHEYFVNVLRTPEDRLMASIVGVPGSLGRRPLLSIAQLLDGFSGWLNREDTLLLKFEDLVGASGGGLASSQQTAINRIALHINRSLDPVQMQRISSGVHAKGSATLRRGVIGDWHTHFTDEHREVFGELAGPYLAKWGYEG